MNSHDPENSVAAAATTQDASRAPMVYQGASACGPVGLVLDRAPDAVCAVTGAEQVLRLAQAEPLIRAVEQWLQGPWDPAPHAGTLMDGFRAEVRDPALAPPGTTLVLPLQALGTPPPDALRAPALNWAAQPAMVLLGEVPAEALEQLEPGGLLWLPASFGTPWTVSLIDPVRRLPPCAARLELAAQRLTVAPQDQGAVAGRAAPDGALQVHLACPLQLPLDHWLGWGRAGAAFHWPVPQPWAAELRQGDTVHARGALLPMGAGCGLRIETLAQPAATA